MDLEQRAERVVSKLPLAALAIIVTLAAQFGAVIWWAGTLSERMYTQGSQLQRLEKKLDDLREQTPTGRDIEAILRSIADHESRLRLIESQRTPRL